MMNFNYYLLFAIACGHEVGRVAPVLSPNKYGKMFVSVSEVYYRQENNRNGRSGVREYDRR